jgi:hypothetical protein
VERSVEQDSEVESWESLKWIYVLSHVPVALSRLWQIPHKRMDAKRSAPRDRFNGVDLTELTGFGGASPVAWDRG